MKGMLKRLLSVLFLTIFFNQAFSLESAYERVRYLEPNKNDVVVGRVDAPIEIVEYFSLTCFHCATFHEKQYPLIKKKYIDTGKVKWIQRSFVTDERALKATLLLECKKSDAQGYEKFLSILLARQDAWVTGKNYLDILENMAKLSGMNQLEVTKCLNDQETGKKYMQDRIDALKVLKLKGTPAFFVNGDELENGFEMKAFEDAIAKKINGK
jgi:protein-disulfide isomerase